MTQEQIRAFLERILPYLEREMDKAELTQVCELAIKTSQSREKAKLSSP